MTPVSLAGAGQIYECTDKCSWAIHSAQHPLFRKFCIGLTQFDRALGDYSSDDFWKPWLRRLRRYRFDVASAPLPFDHPEVILEQDLAWLQAQVPKCESLFPAFACDADALIGQLREIVSSQENPMLQLLRRILPDDTLHPAAVLLKEPRLIPAVEGVLIHCPSLKRISLVSTQQLRGSSCYAKLAVIGPARWYPDYVFMAPRARSIDIVQYGWIGSHWEPRTSFAGGSSARLPNFKLAKVGDSATQPELDALDLVPPVDWDNIAATGKAHHMVDHSQVDVEARLFLLTGNAAVYLDADEQSTATVIDLNQDGTATVKPVPVRRIEAGTFVLLRTKGSGDYVVSVADGLMKEKAVDARALQARWKDSLADYVREKGMQATCTTLKCQGAKHANKTNVCNWMNKRKLRPEADADFIAILKLTGLDAETGIYLAAMQLIENTHLRAGQLIRDLLEKQVASAYLEDMHRLGKMDFELPDTGSGVLTAFRVEDISPHTFSVPPSLLGHPFDSEGFSWRV